MKLTKQEFNEKMIEAKRIVKEYGTNNKGFNEFLDSDTNKQINLILSLIEGALIEGNDILSKSKELLFDAIYILNEMHEKLNGEKYFKE